MLVTNLKTTPYGLKSDRHVLWSKYCCSSCFFSEQSPHFELHSISRNLCYHMLPTDLDIMPLKPSQNPYTSHSISRKSISNSKKNQQNPYRKSHRKIPDQTSLAKWPEAVQLGVKSVVLFPKTPDELKTQTAEVEVDGEFHGLNSYDQSIIMVNHWTSWYLWDIAWYRSYSGI